MKKFFNMKFNIVSMRIHTSIHMHKCKIIKIADQLLFKKIMEIALNLLNQNIIIERLRQIETFLLLSWKNRKNILTKKYIHDTFDYS